MRWYSLLPDTQWTNEYYTPIGDTKSGVWLYNPNSSSITVTATYKDGSSLTTTTINVSEKGHEFFAIPAEGTGYKFSSASSFFGITQTDIVYSGQVNDWGHPLIPASSLTSKVVVGLAYGCKNNDCPSGTTAPPNPVWITATEDAVITVDYNADGSDVETFNLDALEMRNIQGRLPDLDMTGAIITGNAQSGGGEVNIALAWGQNHDNTLSESYNLDMGTVSPNAHGKWFTV